MRTIVLVLLFSLFLGCSTEKVSPDAVELGVSFRWTDKDRGTSRNPEIKVYRVPEGTKRFYVELVDLNNPGFSHGSGFVDHDGSGIIRRGAVNGSYGGPDPPPPIVHRYEFTVKALDADGTVIGIGKMAKAFPPEQR